MVKAGARTVHLTVRSAESNAKLFSVVLRCRNRGASLFDSYVAALNLTNYLCSAAATAAGKKGRDRLVRIEAIRDFLQDFEDRTRREAHPSDRPGLLRSQQGRAAHRAAA